MPDPQSRSGQTPRFLSSGDTGLTVQLSDRADLEANRRVRQLAARLAQADVPGVVETVPTYRSLLIHYDPLQTSQATLIDCITPLVTNEPSSVARQTRIWTFPICFEDEFAPDLAFIADHAGIKPDDIIEILAETSQVVYMIGFAPGQPYLGDLPDNMSIPRRNNPIPSVPVGSVVTATGKTVIYSVSNPTGWYLIGRTPVELFRRKAESPILLTPGDYVRFRPVPIGAYEQIKAKVEAGAYQPEFEEH